MMKQCRFCVLVLLFVCAPIVAAVDDDGVTKIPELDIGWSWELKPQPVTNALAEFGFNRFVESGLLSATLLHDEMLLVQHVRNTGFDLVGTQAPEYRVYVLGPDGQRLDFHVAMGMGKTGLASNRYLFANVDAPERVGKIGLAVLTYEGRRELSAARRIEAQEQGIDVLPLPEIGKPFPFDLPLADGGRIRSEDTKGMVVLFDGWATWCGPCMTKMPQLRKVHEEYAEQGLVVIGLNFDREWELAEQAIEEHSLDWAHVHCVETEEHRRYWYEVTSISSLPRLFVVDREGILREDVYPHDLEALLKTYFVDEAGDDDG